MSKPLLFLWDVSCPGYDSVTVVAVGMAEATVAAAKKWDVKWRTVAAYCVVKNKRAYISDGRGFDYASRS